MTDSKNRYFKKKEAARLLAQTVSMWLSEQPLSLKQTKAYHAELEFYARKYGLVKELRKKGIL